MPILDANRRREGASEFQDLVGPVLQKLRAAFSGILDSIPSPEPISRPIDLQRALGVRSTLAWQIHKLATSTDPFAQGASIPGPEALRRFLQAAARKGAPDRVVEAAVRAAGEFDTFVREHAPDRSAFGSMISALHRDASQRVDLQHKRAAFRANSHIWGIQAKTHLTFSAVQPSTPDSDKLDYLSLRGFVGLKRLRRESNWVVSRSRFVRDDGQVYRPPGYWPLDPESANSTVPLLQRFCSRPLPRFRSVPERGGFDSVELEPTDVGNKAAVTCMMGDFSFAGLARYRSGIDTTLVTQTMVRTPSRVLVHDMMIHESVILGSPQVKVFGDHRLVDPAIYGRERDRLTIAETLKLVGRGISALHTPDVPRYAEMVSFAMEKAGWNPERFNLYRCRVEFPVMPSSVAIQFDLPEKPAADGDSDGAP